MITTGVAMKVYDLCCENDHRFEGWFSSEGDFVQQSERALIACPMCDSRAIKKLLSAPRLNLSGGNSEQKQQGIEEKAQALMLKMTRHVLANTDDVGENFAEEARRIHYSEIPERGIRGVTTAEERASLADEGIDILPLPLPDVIKQALQ